jgi:Asp-tRNA(Asn)/Glu-tRNA(Gln) amidotransferase A subunit family amidase
VTDLSFLSVAELSAAIHSRQMSAIDLTTHFLDRLEKLGSMPW